MSSHPIRLSSVDFSSPDGTTVLNGLDLLVPAGRSALVRADGAGESTIVPVDHR
jgi:ABC-type transport system involved in cytochrome bd biosynthesis fused ATPase/permease subunit